METVEREREREDLEDMEGREKLREKKKGSGECRKKVRKRTRRDMRVGKDGCVREKTEDRELEE